jgi:AcrR family transcriptional regulator
MARTLDETKRAAILAAARATFCRDGYEAAKMSDIAAEAGVASGTLYLYFKSKEALASAIGEDFFKRLSEQFGEIVKNFRGPESVEMLFDWAMQVATQERDVLSLPDQAAPTAEVPESRMVLLNQLTEVLADLMSQGLVRRYNDPQTLAEFVLLTIKWVVKGQCHNHRVDEVKATAILVLQHALFDDLTLAANRLIQSNQAKK